MHKHDVFHDLDRFVCNLKTCSRSHVRQQSQVVSACELKTLLWNIGFRNCCTNYRHKMHKYLLYPWNQEDLTLSRSGYSETFWSQGSFRISYTVQKMKFSVKFPADLVTITKEILNGKLNFLCSASEDIAGLVSISLMLNLILRIGSL